MCKVLVKNTRVLKSVTVMTRRVFPPVSSHVLSAYAHTTLTTTSIENGTRAKTGTLKKGILINLT